MGSNSSFYNQNSTTYTDTNPAAPADTPVSNDDSAAPSSFFKATGADTSPTVLIAGIPVFTPITNYYLTGINAAGAWQYARPFIPGLDGQLLQGVTGGEPVFTGAATLNTSLNILDKATGYLLGGSPMLSVASGYLNFYNPDTGNQRIMSAGNSGDPQNWYYASQFNFHDRADTPRLWIQGNDGTIVWPAAGNLTANAGDFNFSKPDDRVNAYRYTFANAGGLTGDPAGGFWRGVHIAPPAITDPVGGATLFPRTSFYYEYNSLSGPTSRIVAIDLANDTATSRHSFALRNNGTQQLLVSPQGWTTIGASAQMQSSGTNSRLQVQQLAASEIGISVIGYGNSVNETWLEFAKTRNVSPTGHTIVQNGDYINGIYFAGSDGVSFIHSAAIGVMVNGASGVGSVPMAMTFYTAPASAGDWGYLNRLQINATGEVAINYANASVSPLTVYTKQFYYPSIVGIDNSAAVGWSFAPLNGSGVAKTSYFLADYQSLTFQGPPSGAVLFGIDNGGGGLTEFMRFNSAGQALFGSYGGFDNGVNANAQLILQGTRGGGLLFNDGGTFLGLWSTNFGQTLNIGLNGSSGGITSYLNFDFNSGAGKLSVTGPGATWLSLVGSDSGLDLSNGTQILRMGSDGRMQLKSQTSAFDFLGNSGTLYSVGTGGATIYNFCELASPGVADGVYVADIYGSGSTPHYASLRLRIDSVTPGAEFSSWRIGVIGNGTAKEALRITGNAVSIFAGLGVNDLDGTQVQVHGFQSIFCWDNVDPTNSAGLQLNRSRSASIGTYTIVQADDRLGEVNFLGADGSQFQTAACIHAYVDGTPGAADMPGRLSFRTTPDGTNSAVERVRIDSNGYTTLGNSANLVLDGSQSWLQVLAVDSSPWGLSTVLFSNDAPGPNFGQAKSRGTTIGDYTIVQSNDCLGGNYYYGADGGTFKNAAAFLIEVDGAPAANSIPGRFRFLTNSVGGSSVVERLKIDNVGLSTFTYGGTDFHSLIVTGAGTLGTGIKIVSTATGGAGWTLACGTTAAALTGGFSFYSEALATAAAVFNSSGQFLSTQGFGYGPAGQGVGGTVTQATSKSTGVTLNKMNGTITMNAAALAAGAQVIFVLTNSNIGANDNVVVSTASSTAGYQVNVNRVAAGSCNIVVRNGTAGSLSEALLINFTVIKGCNT